MIKNYLLICFRNIQRNSVFSFLNIAGLAIGIASCVVILQYVSFEASYDQFHSKKDLVYRVDTHYYSEEEDYGKGYHSSYMLAPTILDEVSGVATYSRVHMQYGGAVVTYEGDVNIQFFEEQDRMYYVDQSYFDLFDFELLHGDRHQLLTEPFSIVITEFAASKYIKDGENPLGKLLKVDGGWYPGTYKVTGVLKDLPDNTLFSFDFLMPVSDLLKNEQYVADDGWGWNNFESYVLLEENADFSTVGQSAVNILNDREEEATEEKSDVVFSALNDLHLRDEAVENPTGLTQKTLNFFILIAAFIILIAWLNYINLSTAQALKRAKEVGIRKSVGAFRNQLIVQFLIEALLVNSIALVLGLLIAATSLPILSDVLGKELLFGVGIAPSHWLTFGLVFLVGTLLSGFYPALVLSNFKPAIVIKGVKMSGTRKFGLRQVLVIAQLSIGVFLIAGTITVFRQLNYMRDQDLGMEVSQILAIRSPRIYDDREQAQSKMKTFLNEVTTYASVSKASTSAAVPGDHNWGTNMYAEGADESESESVRMIWVDENFSSTYGMELLAGRFHSADLSGDESQIVVNETLVEEFGFGTNEDALGKKLFAGDNGFTIIGVLKDYHWYSLKDEIMPLMFNYTEFGRNVSVKIETADIRDAMASIEESYSSLFPGNPFDYKFIDEIYDQQYKADRQFGEIFTVFSGIAIFIACLGLFGLASFTLSLRIKEIGVRKVLGAGISTILMMIYKDYLKLILLAALIGIPAIYFAIENWLAGFAYRINLSVDLLVLPIVTLVTITLGTISYQAIKAATSNPTRSLRSE